VFPLGVFMDKDVEPWFHPEKPEFDADKMLEVLEAETDEMPTFTKGFPTHLDPDDVSIKLAGSGGDGAQTAALLITKAAITEGFDATHIPSYGPESRGGTSYADVHVAREEVLSPAAAKPLVLVAFNAPSLAKFGPAVKENGIVVYDSSAITEVPEFAPGVKVVPVPCGAIAQSLGTRVVKNVVALGALQEATNILDEDSFLTALRVSLQHKCAMIPLNEEAFRWGVKAVRENITEIEQ
jgi:Pyruvate/2-oxoacid:ferredoxin oxidoreductase gamma subunit